MKAYGVKPTCWLDEEFGPPSRYAKITSRNRSAWRRVLHKQGRRTGRNEIATQLKESEGAK